MLDVSSAGSVLAIGPEEVARARARALRRTDPVDVARTVAMYAAEHARSEPGLIAVADRGRQITYRDLVGWAVELADTLREVGCRPGDVVAVAGPRSALTVAAFLAAELTGTVYLPVDERWPKQRVADVLRASGARALLHSPGSAGADGEPIRDAARDAGVPVVAAGTEPSTSETTDLPAGAGSVDETQVRYLIYTSGSTGRPKGARVEQRGMLNHLWSKVADLELGRGDSVAFTAPVAFDISIWQMLAPLLVGGRVVIVPDVDLRFPRRLRLVLDRAEVRVAELVPTVLRMLVDELRRRPGDGRLSRLRFLLATGEELPAVLAGEVLRALPAVTLVNAYGPTECSDDVTHHVVTPDDIRQARVPIGRPIRNTTLYVLRSDGEQWYACAHGESGELFVGGLGVGRGYHADPEATAAAFFADPFEPNSPTGRVYRTGDLVRVDDAGVLGFLGRVDRQVKVSGVRMELGEIEAVLNRHPGIASCAVAVTRSDGEPELLAYYVPTGAPPTDGELREYLASRLPTAMVPRQWVALSELPVTLSGKVDYRRLANPAPADSPAPTTPAGPSSPMAR